MLLVSVARGEVLWMRVRSRTDQKDPVLVGGRPEDCFCQNDSLAISVVGDLPVGLKPMLAAWRGNAGGHADDGPFRPVRRRKESWRPPDGLAAGQGVSDPNRWQAEVLTLAGPHHDLCAAGGGAEVPQQAGRENGGHLSVDRAPSAEAPWPRRQTGRMTEGGPTTPQR